MKIETARGGIEPWKDQKPPIKDSWKPIIIAIAGLLLLCWGSILGVQLFTASKQPNAVSVQNERIEETIEPMPEETEVAMPIIAEITEDVMGLFSTPTDTVRISTPQITPTSDILVTYTPYPTYTHYPTYTPAPPVIVEQPGETIIVTSPPVIVEQPPVVVEQPPVIWTSAPIIVTSPPIILTSEPIIIIATSETTPLFPTSTATHTPTQTATVTPTSTPTSTASATLTATISPESTEGF